MDDMEEEIVADIDEASEEENDYLNSVLTESQYMDDHSEDIKDEDGFEKNKEGVTGDEWKEDAKKQLEQEMDEEDVKERNRRNAERRIANKARKAQADEEESDTEEGESRLEDSDLDAAELNSVRGQVEHYETMIREAAPYMQMISQNKMNPEEFQIGVDFVNNWKADKIGTVKRLLTSLQNSGIDVGQILTHDDREMQIRGEVDRRMQPMYSQQQENNARMRAQNELNSFLAKYPDANGHLEEITQVLRKLGSTNLEDAYFRMRRAYVDRNMSWFGDEAEDMIEEEVMNPPSVASQNVGGYEPPTMPTSITDLVRQNTHNYFRNRR